MSDKKLREELISMLTKEQAHISIGSALKDLKAGNRTVRPSPGLHSVWELLEHIRITQEDILQYILDPGWISPPWPEGYWPEKNRNISNDEWNNSIKQFQNDLEKLLDIVKDENIDLTATIPHTKNHSYLREILIAADHNSYHIAQIVQTRKHLGDWN